MLYAIGELDRQTGQPDVLGYVCAEAPDAAIDGLMKVGDDDLSFWALTNRYVDLALKGDVVTPFSLAVDLAGRNATVHCVEDDGSLTGWRRVYDPDELHVPSRTLT